MRFWDASAVIPLLAAESSSASAQRRLDEDAELLAWWGTPVEITSALARREREGLLSAEQVSNALASARALAEGWYEILPSPSLRWTAERLLRVHPLRAADSLQLAAATIAADHNPPTLEFVCFDQRLAAAAGREGFKVLDT